MGKSDPLKSVDPALAKLGFVRVRPVRKKRITMEVSGRTKTGKTRIALTMPQPIGILNTDRSLEDILPEFPDVDVIVKDFSKKFAPGQELTQAEAKALEADFNRAYQALLGHHHIRSLAIDKWTTIWEVARYAQFGQASMKAHHYVPVNLRMRGYLNAARDSDKNILLIQDTKEEWIGEKPTGRWIVDGFKYTPGMMQVNAEMLRLEEMTEEDAGFRLKVTGCGVNAELVGWEFENDDIDFAKVALMVLPDTKAADWK